MSMTAEQNEATRARGKVLVSASAGAGKTTVMIKRLADVLEEGGDLDGVLAVTFTKKAAANMKDKLRDELLKRLAAASGERRDNLRAQLGKINTADISTIDSFCARLVRTYFYVLGGDGEAIDASFEVLADGAEERALRGRAIDDLFGALYAEKDESFLLLLESYRKKRNDDALKKMISAAYSEIRIRPDYKKLLAETAKNCGDDGFERVCASYSRTVRDKCEALASLVIEFASTFRPTKNGEKYAKCLTEMRDTLTEFAARGDIFNPPARLGKTNKPPVCEQTAEDDARFTEFRSGVADTFKALFKNLGTYEEERARFLNAAKLASAFSDVLIKFDGVYASLKREEGKLDYGDLEQFALEILKDEDVRGQINAKYRYAFVDEYQDINPIQDQIISAVAREDVFCVGDVKQAIYGFRGSRSEFFTEKIKNIGEGQYVVLPHNFRSADKVIEFVNRLFSFVMRPPVCGLDYSEGHEMRGGGLYPREYGGSARLVYYEADSATKKTAEGIYSVEEDAASAEEITAEGRAVLNLIEEALQSQYYDPDEGRLKPVQQGDICVLTRKRSSASARGILKAVSSRYPVSSVAETNICDRPEIKRLLGVLSYLDNGEQDVALVTALLSPLGNLNEAELAKIRIYGGRGRHVKLFRKCAKAYAEERDDGLSQKLNVFYGRINRLRECAECVGAARLVDEIMRVGGFAACFRSENAFEAVRRFQSAAGDLFLNAFLAKLKAGGYRIDAPAALSSDCIKIMTMHASKGLEFPVVIVADVAQSFKGDSYEEMPFSDEFGFAPKSFDRDSRKYYTTLLRRIFAERAAAEERDNEINLLYVACTRAKYTLRVLDGGLKEYNSARALNASSYADFFDKKIVDCGIVGTQFDLKQGGQSGILDESRSDMETLGALKKIAADDYAYEEGIGLPVKSSATQLMALRGDDNALPLFDEGALSGDTDAEKGTAYHRFLELCDFAVKDDKGIESELAKFEYEGLITRRQREIISVAKLKTILSMPVFDGLSGREIYREREFVCKLPSSDFMRLKNGDCDGLRAAEDDGNGVIVQGAIDLLVLKKENGKVVAADIVDYKDTSHSDGFVAAKYAPQLGLYKSVVRRIYGLSEDKVTTTIVNVNAARLIKL